MGRVEMKAGIEPLTSSHETALKGKGVDQVELAPHHNPTAGLLRLLNCEAAILEAEHV